jgi:hypothetical protein
MFGTFLYPRPSTPNGGDPLLGDEVPFCRPTGHPFERMGGCP